ncbi:MAG: tRNA pseudouridine(38-40) synthase TruA, partial [Candidatus Omnitrophica bacterium]|nr:tRNA pseudouridine(38-40) synthase TruA [Candidatus Omnitrophota bacterium]
LGIKTVQKTIEDTLEKILCEKVKLIASGRTDSGVHALGQVANFKTNSSIPKYKLLYALNSLLPKDIVVKKVEDVDMDFHSRFSAISKIYRYTILNSKIRSPFLNKRAFFYPYPLDINLMRREAKKLLGRHNFLAFQNSDKVKRDSIRRIKKIRILKEGNLIHIDIEADGFVYGMVRNIVGVLLQIGRKKPINIEELLKSKIKPSGYFKVPAEGLYLVKVNY